MARQFEIIGAGMGSESGLTAAARRAIETADAVFCTARLAESLGGIRAMTVCSYRELAERAVRDGGERAAVLVSGDVGFFSAAQILRERLLPFGAVTLHCGLSSLQTLCAACGTGWDDAVSVSLHGRAGEPVGAVSYHKKTFFLTDPTHRADALCTALTAAGLGGVRVTVGENLGAAKERIRSGTAAELANVPTDGLAAMLVQHDGAAEPLPLRDCDFVRGSVPMTKQEVRWTAVNLLAVRPGETIWDVGAGTGSVAIELARKTQCGTVYAVEYKEEALALIEENRRALGAYNVYPVTGKAPEALRGLPTPDAVFIGGSSGNLEDILALLREKNPCARVVVSAIALETLETARQSMKKHGFDPEICQIAVSRGRQVGAYTMMMAQNPVFLLAGEGENHA